MSATASFAFQGALGAFSHQAALAFARRFHVSGELRPCTTFGEVFAEVAAGSTAYGVIPLENSSIGSIVANYDLLWSNEAWIVAEYLLPVHHHLIGFAGTKADDVRMVYSHPAALDQCRKLFKQYPHMVACVHWDTSGAVAHVKESVDKRTAAIAGELAASEYGLSILLQNVEDYPHNATRFGLIAPAARARARERPTAAYKMSLAVELGHKVGSLAELLNVLAAAGANLTKIESRPIGETPWHYRFFIDAELPDPNLEDSVISAAQRASENCKLLGRYQKIGEPVEKI